MAARSHVSPPTDGSFAAGPHSATDKPFCDGGAPSAAECILLATAAIRQYTQQKQQQVLKKRERAVAYPTDAVVDLRAEPPVEIATATGYFAANPLTMRTALMLWHRYAALTSGGEVKPWGVELPEHEDSNISESARSRWRVLLVYDGRAGPFEVSPDSEECLCRARATLKQHDAEWTRRRAGQKVVADNSGENEASKAQIGGHAAARSGLNDDVDDVNHTLFLTDNLSLVETLIVHAPFWLPDVVDGLGGAGGVTSEEEKDGPRALPVPGTTAPSPNGHYTPAPAATQLSKDIWTTCTNVGSALACLTFAAKLRGVSIRLASLLAICSPLIHRLLDRSTRRIFGFNLSASDGDPTAVGQGWIHWFSTRDTTITPAPSDRDATWIPGSVRMTTKALKGLSQRFSSDADARRRTYAENGFGMVRDAATFVGQVFEKVVAQESRSFELLLARLCLRPVTLSFALDLPERHVRRILAALMGLLASPTYRHETSHLSPPSSFAGGGGAVESSGESQRPPQRPDSHRADFGSLSAVEWLAVGLLADPSAGQKLSRAVREVGYFGDGAPLGLPTASKLASIWQALGETTLAVLQRLYVFLPPRRDSAATNEGGRRVESSAPDLTEFMFSAARQEPRMAENTDVTSSLPEGFQRRRTSGRRQQQAAQLFLLCACHPCVTATAAVVHALGVLLRAMALPASLIPEGVINRGRCSVAEIISFLAAAASSAPQVLATETASLTGFYVTSADLPRSASGTAGVPVVAPVGMCAFDAFECLLLPTTA